MARRSHRQILMQAAEKHEEHKHVIEFFLLVSADFVVRLISEPDHVSHSLKMIAAAILGQ